MRLISFTRQGQAGFGAVVGDGVVDLAGRLGLPALADCLADRLAEVAALVARTAPDFALAELRLLPPIPAPAKILCVGVNYVDHREETGRRPNPYPTIFTRFADSVVGPEAALIRPRLSQAFDYEGELAVIIGRPAWRVDAAGALAHVAGYACFHDGSVRDYQAHSSQFTPGKNFPASGSLGPWLVTADAVPDPQALALTTRVSGVVLQAASTAQMIFPVAELISYLSRFTVLRAGDVIATGTPGGVGFTRAPPRFLVPGDVVEVAIEGIGVLRNPVIDEG